MVCLTPVNGMKSDSVSSLRYQDKKIKLSSYVNDDLLDYPTLNEPESEVITEHNGEARSAIMTPD